MHPLTLLLRVVRPPLVGLVDLADWLYPRRRFGAILLIDKCVDRHEHGNYPLARLEAALDLLRRLDPRRAAHAQRHLRRIEIASIPGRRGVWKRRLKRCAISLDLLVERPLAETAATLVHEVTHARLHNRGLRFETACRGREEGCCIKEQIRFWKRVPDSEQLVALLEAHLKLVEGGLDAWSEFDREDLRELNWSERSIDRLLRFRDFMEPYQPD